MTKNGHGRRGNSGMLAKKSFFTASFWILKAHVLVQAAIDMANVELKYGSYQPLLDMAHEIIASQSMELTQFRNILFVQYAVSA